MASAVEGRRRVIWKGQILYVAVKSARRLKMVPVQFSQSTLKLKPLCRISAESRKEPIKAIKAKVPGLTLKKKRSSIHGFLLWVRLQDPPSIHYISLLSASSLFHYYYTVIDYHDYDTVINIIVILSSPLLQLYSCTVTLSHSFVVTLPDSCCAAYLIYLSMHLVFLYFEGLSTFYIVFYAVGNSFYVLTVLFCVV